MDYRVWIGIFFIFVFAVCLLACSGLMDRPRNVVLCTTLTVLALGLRVWCFPHVTGDYTGFLAPWIEFFRANGGVHGLKYSIGNYNVPYLYFLALFSYSDLYGLYLIKLLSVFFDVVLAWSSMQLAGVFTRDTGKRIFTFFAVLFLPTVVLNGAYWGQCDAIYVAFAVMALWLALSSRPVLSMVCFAVSFSFKLQAVFILPVIAVLWYRKKFSLWHAVIFPVTYLVIVLPAVLLGRPLIDTLTLYLNQTGSIGSGLNYNSPSFFAFFLNGANTAFWSKAGILAAFVFLFAVLIWLYKKRGAVNDEVILTAALLFAVAIPWLLPHMHDRYFFAADVLSLVFAVAFPRLCFVPVLCQFASLLGYHAYLKGRYLFPMSYGAAALAVVIVVLIAFIIYHFPAQRRRKAR